MDGAHQRRSEHTALQVVRSAHRLLLKLGLQRLTCLVQEFHLFAEVAVLGSFLLQGYGQTSRSQTPTAGSCEPCRIERTWSCETAKSLSVSLLRIAASRLEL